MHDQPERPLASPIHEEHARALFPLHMSPEEYAAREGHRWGCFSFDEYRYSDPAMDRWIQRLGDIFFRRNGAPSVDELRQRYLTPAEMEAIDSESKEF